MKEEIKTNQHLIKEYQAHACFTMDIQNRSFSYDGVGRNTAGSHNDHCCSGN